MLSLKSIRSKFMLPTLFLTVLLLSLLGMFLSINSYSTIHLILNNKANSTADFISKISLTSYMNFEYFDLDTLVQEIKKDPEVDYAVFYDSKGEPLTKTSTVIAPSFINISKNISEENGNNLGVLKIGFNRSTLDSNLRNSLTIIVLSIFATINIFIFCMKTLSEKVVINRIVDMEKLSEKLSNGELSVVVNTDGHDEIASLGKALNKVSANLKEFIDKTETRNNELEEWQKIDLWVKSGLNDINMILREEQDLTELADRTLAFIAEFIDAGTGILYRYDEIDKMLYPISTYASANSERLKNGLHLGEGLPGQVALERKAITLNSVPSGYLPITSSMGSSDPASITIMPIIHNDKLTGVLELGSFRQFNSKDDMFLKQTLEGIAIALNANRARQLINELLEQTQSQAEELRVQQEELQQTNEELLERTRVAEEMRKA
ncbi:MAG: GAF domain-containing protein [Desulfuromonadaceae bacterium]|nr:GAF domain-containing protein [Desulfuromonadaceae bacterium]MDD2856742.1 GAF domain-containing protein [Desulfuromonadaceae bacterium]